MGHFHPFPMAMFETTWIHWIPPQLGKLWYFLGTSPLSIAKYGKVSPIDFNIYIYIYYILYIILSIASNLDWQRVHQTMARLGTGGFTQALFDGRSPSSETWQ